MRCAHAAPFNSIRLRLIEVISESRVLEERHALQASLIPRENMLDRRVGDPRRGWFAGHYLTGYRRGGRENRSARTRSNSLPVDGSRLADRLKHGSASPAVAPGDRLVSTKQPE
jgi:hypothetical protein